MKRALLALVLLWLCGCGVVGGGVDVTVTNPTSYEREHESVEIEWAELAGRGITADRVIVEDEQRNQIPSQVIFDKKGVAQKLLFQSSVGASAQSHYKIRRRRADSYESKVYGRYVPERMDDYAWENNLTAYRIYGPRLSDPKTQGVDVWVKNTQKLIINEWFARNDYHHNYGEGMDCYKVGNTLGGGALAVVDDSKLLLSGNYLRQACVANGPLRTEAEFVYAPVSVGNREVVIKRRIWLDANSRFTFQEYELSGFEGEIEVAAGMVMHDVKDISQDENWIALTEPASDSGDAKRDGDIMLGVILQGAQKQSRFETRVSPNQQVQHALILRKAKAGEKILMLNGSAWSHASVAGGAEWAMQVKQAADRLNNPLQVELK
ncbi:MAG: DUF4861 family protein [Alistipes sp.]|nr:DUF4861 family protein [Alistipes sp.]